MTNATIQTVLSFPTLPAVRSWENGTISGLYRSAHWDRVLFSQNLGEAYSPESTTEDTWPNVAHSIWHEAQRLDMLTDAYSEKFARALQVVGNEPLPALVPEFDQDTEAAFVQAELLGATADQRAKLRAIVTARINAERALTESTRQLASVRQQLATANEDILDGHDPRTMQLFANTGAVADKQGLCSVYDQIARDSLIPTRPELANAGYVGEGASRDYYVTVSVSVNVSTSISVTASDEDEAARMVSDMDHRDIWDSLDLSSASHYDISDVETGDVEEA